jgi:uncharacterized protein YggU (UPF0235/DUF167 family)
MPDKSLKIKTTVAPIDGEANQALIKLLSKHFNIAKSQIKIKINYREFPPPTRIFLLEA